MNEGRVSADLGPLSGIPRDQEGPIFRAPWEAQAFAMAVKLHEAGHYTWKEWAAALAAEIRGAGERGEEDDGSRYYHHWLSALEKIAAAKGLITTRELINRKNEWELAAQRTPHGQPIELQRRFSR